MNSLQMKLMFMRMMILFNVNRINITHCGDQRIEAIVGWPDEGQPHYSAEEEVQAVIWDFVGSPEVADASLVLDVIARDSLLRGDRIEIERADLLGRLMNTYSWGIDRAEKALSEVLEVRIDMVDEGNVTDALFLHF